MKNRKATVGCFVGILAVAYLPIVWVMQFLVYQHIHATDVMWTLFWISIPVGFLVTASASVFRNVFTDD